MNTSTARQLHLNCFNHLLDLDAIGFPPPPPEPDEQWVNNNSELWSRFPAKPNMVKVEGWRVYVPGHGIVFLQSEGKAITLHSYLTSHLKASSYLFELGGDLYDTRKQDMNAPLRTGYMGLHTKITNGQQLKSTLRSIPNEPYQASMYFITAEDFHLCPDCVRKELVSVVSSIRHHTNSEGRQVVGFDTLWEAAPDSPVTCDHCCRIIPAVYGDE